MVQVLYQRKIIRVYKVTSQYELAIHNDISIIMLLVTTYINGLANFIVTCVKYTLCIKMITRGVFLYGIKKYPERI